VSRKPRTSVPTPSRTILRRTINQRVRFDVPTLGYMTVALSMLEPVR
jgi:hypothetical protein